jgi:hypothetical protein
VSSLTLLSCGVTSASTEDQIQVDKKGKMLLAICKKDFRYLKPETLNSKLAPAPNVQITPDEMSLLSKAAKRQGR